MSAEIINLNDSGMLMMNLDVLSNEDLVDVAYETVMGEISFDSPACDVMEEILQRLTYNC